MLSSQNLKNRLAEGCVWRERKGEMPCFVPYQHLSSLDNPVPDAKAVAATLKAHRFDVSENYDLTRADLLDALKRFEREAQGAEVALVYYAGHGMEVDGKNVVAPTDMEIECENKTTIRSVALDQLFAAAGPAPQQIVLLDACRNNPFPQCPTRGANSGSGFRGFSRLGMKTARAKAAS
jgi:uncharacterized caspase-like protein